MQYAFHRGARRRVSSALVMLGIAAACSDSMALAPDMSGSNPDAPSRGTTPPDATTTPASSGLAGVRLYVAASTSALSQANAWRASRPSDALLMDRLAAQPVAKWLGGWNGDVRADARATANAASAAGRVPLFVVYNIPSRDCGGYSAGGENSPAGYQAWIREVAAGITAGSIVIVEPDALAGMDCLSAAMQEERITLLRDAAAVLKAAGARVYLDAGHARWLSATAAAERLRRAGVDRTDGFALNVSNFVQNEENIPYGEQISGQVGGKHFLIDTSRNGNGPISADAWCNPRGRALGKLPTTSTGHALVDAFLWVKVPGESDGPCNGGPQAGQWWADYALELAKNQPETFASVGG